MDFFKKNSKFKNFNAYLYVFCIIMGYKSAQKHGVYRFYYTILNHLVTFVTFKVDKRS